MNHNLKEDVKAIQLLHEHYLGRGRDLKLLLDIVGIEDNGKFLLDVLSHRNNVFFFVHAASFTSIRSLHF